MTYEISSKSPNDSRRSGRTRTRVDRRQQLPNAPRFVPNNAPCRFESQHAPAHRSTNQEAASIQGESDIRTSIVLPHLQSPAAPRQTDPTVPRYVPREGRQEQQSASAALTPANASSYEIATGDSCVPAAAASDQCRDRPNQKDGDLQAPARPHLEPSSKSEGKDAAWSIFECVDWGKNDEQTKSQWQSHDVQFAGFWANEAVGGWPSTIVAPYQCDGEQSLLVSSARHHNPVSLLNRHLSSTRHSIVPAVVVQGVCAILIESNSSLLILEASVVKGLATDIPWSSPSWIPTQFLEELDSVVSTRDVSTNLTLATNTVWASIVDTQRFDLQDVCCHIRQCGLCVTSTLVTTLLLTLCYYRHAGARSSSRSNQKGSKQRKLSSNLGSPSQQRPIRHETQVSPPPRPRVQVISVFKSQPGILWACQVHKFDPEHYTQCAQVYPKTELSLRRKNGHLDQKHNHEEHVRLRKTTLTPNASDTRKWREAFVGIYPLYESVIDELNPEHDYPLLENKMLERQLREEQKQYLLLSVEQQDHYLAQNSHTTQKLASSDSIIKAEACLSTNVLSGVASMRPIRDVASEPTFDSGLDNERRPITPISAFETVRQAYILHADIWSTSDRCCMSLQDKLDILGFLEKLVTSVDGIMRVLKHIEKAKIGIPLSESGNHECFHVQQAFDDARTYISRLITMTGVRHVEAVPFLQGSLDCLGRLNACCSDAEALGSFVEDLLRAQPRFVDVLDDSHTLVSLYTPPPSVEHSGSDDIIINNFDPQSIGSVSFAPPYWGLGAFSHWQVEDHHHPLFNTPPNIDNECIDPALLATQTATQNT